MDAASFRMEVTCGGFIQPQRRSRAQEQHKNRAVTCDTGSERGCRGRRRRPQQWSSCRAVVCSSVELIWAVQSVSLRVGATSPVTFPHVTAEKTENTPLLLRNQNRAHLHRKTHAIHLRHCARVPATATSSTLLPPPGDPCGDDRAVSAVGIPSS